jgi:hypothetical protein
VTVCENGILSIEPEQHLQHLQSKANKRAKTHAHSCDSKTSGLEEPVFPDTGRRGTVGTKAGLIPLETAQGLAEG